MRTSNRDACNSCPGRSAFQLLDFTSIHESDAGAALGFVEIRSRDQNRQPFGARCTSVSQNSRRETGSTPVVGSSSSSTRGSPRARRQRKFLLHTAAELAGEPVFERRHAEH